MDFTLHLAVAALLGTLIGLERQWRQRFAGLRTNALVATGAAVFASAALSSAAGGNASPMLGQIISGIGFLGAGVIFKEDFNVRGLNTAATIWCSAAVGMLCGLGLLPQAAVTATAVIAINVGLRPLVRNLSERPASEASESLAVYGISFVSPKKGEARLRALLVQLSSAFHLSLKKLHSEKARPGEVRISAELSLFGRNDHKLEDLAGRLSLEPAVSSLRWQLLKNDASFE